MLKKSLKVTESVINENNDEPVNSKDPKENLHFEEQHKYNYINLSNFVQVDNQGAGFCLFESLLTSFGIDSANHLNLRNSLCDFILKNTSFYEEMIFLETNLSVEAYINKMKLDGEWVVMVEIHVASLVLSANIIIYRQSELYSNKIFTAEKFYFYESEKKYLKA
jgi:hypothetical protein